MKKSSFQSFTLVLYWLASISLFAQSVNSTGTELLGKPTNNAVTVNVVADAPLSVYYAYATSSGIYSVHTETLVTTADVPFELSIQGILTDTRYYNIRIHKLKYRHFPQVCTL